jgi:hypothetical protein
MYNGNRPGAARREQWKLFQDLGANGMVIPADTSTAEPPQLGSDETPDWWSKAASLQDSTPEDEGGE